MGFRRFGQGFRVYGIEGKVSNLPSVLEVCRAYGPGVMRMGNSLVIRRRLLKLGGGQIKGIATLSINSMCFD